jgi:hypothetical protein
MIYYLWLIPEVGGHTIIDGYPTEERAVLYQRYLQRIHPGEKYLVLPKGKSPWQVDYEQSIQSRDTS